MDIDPSKTAFKYFEVTGYPSLFLWATMSPLCEIQYRLANPFLQSRA
jgi:hypothetical protein